MLTALPDQTLADDCHCTALAQLHRSLNKQRNAIYASVLGGHFTLLSART